MDELDEAHKAVEQAKAALASQAQGGGIPDFWNTHYVLTLSCGLFLFAIFIFTCSTYLLHQGRTAWTLLRLFGVLSIIFLSVFVLIVGYTDKQLLPVMGLFGSIVGYLLGKTTAADKGERPTEPPPETSPDDQGSYNGNGNDAADKKPNGSQGNASGQSVAGGVKQDAPATLAGVSPQSQGRE